MEELQDALEDAQYVNAINLDEGPRPITAWEKPSEEEMNDWTMHRLKQWNDDKGKSGMKNTPLPEPFTYDWVLANSLGFFMFAAFIKSVGNDYVQINFIEDLLRWRYLRGRSRGTKLRSIYDRYLVSFENDKETKQIKKPPLSQINEVDLEYEYGRKKLQKAELEKLVAEHRDDSCRNSALGVSGKLYDKVVKTLTEYFATDSLTDDTAVTVDLSVSSTPDLQHEIDPAEESKEEQINDPCDSSTKAIPPKELFDKFEQVVLELIRIKHWQAFKASSEYTKLINYMWHRDRKVADDDFFLMRVLGRGGFGLVTGKVQFVEYI